MDEHEWLAEQFEAYRTHLRAVAHRMLGSLSEAEDAVQESWLHLSRSDTSGVENLGGWLTTVIARICLDMLRSRSSRREESLEASVPEPITSREGGIDPEQEALLADSVGLALLVVLDTLNPAERLAFVLHDIFAIPFDEIAPIVERSPTATRPHSRACGRVKGGPWCAGRGQAVLRTCPGSATCSRERSRGSRRGPSWSAIPRPQSHGHTRQDRRDQRGRRPRAPPPAAPFGPGQLTSQPPLPLGLAGGEGAATERGNPLHAINMNVLE